MRYLEIGDIAIGTGRPKAQLVLGDEGRTQLQSFARNRWLAAALCNRARLVLASAEGELDIHCIVENYATHSHPMIKAWLVARPRWHMHCNRTRIREHGKSRSMSGARACPVSMLGALWMVYANNSLSTPLSPVITERSALCARSGVRSRWPVAAPDCDQPDAQSGSAPHAADRVCCSMRKLVSAAWMVRASYKVSAAPTITAYNWPGNVRELENIAERIAVFLSQYERPQDVRYEALRHDCPELFGDARDMSATIGGNPERPQRIREAIRLAGGRRDAAARLLGISRSTLWRWLRDTGTTSRNVPPEPPTTG